MHKATKIPIEQVRRVHEILDRAPDLEPDAVTTREAIAQLSSPIARLKAKGYSLSRIAQMLSTSGIPISSETLSTYLTRSKRTRERIEHRKPADAAKTPACRPPRCKRGNSAAAAAEARRKVVETPAMSKARDVEASVKGVPPKEWGGGEGSPPGAASWTFVVRPDSEEI